MISAQQISDAFDKATQEFAASPDYVALISGEAGSEVLRAFIANVFRTHYLSSHIVALCYAVLPSGSTAALLKENLLEEIGRSETERAHCELLLELARGAGFSQQEIDALINDSRRQAAVFCAARVPFATLREICLAVLLETMSFEFMLSRCSSQIAAALEKHYGISKAALKWFELHSEVDIRHAEEGLTVIQDYVSFHQISDATFDRILRLTFEGDAFGRRYFPPGTACRTQPVATSANAKRIESITIYQLRIPFRQSFSHALKSRGESDAVVVRVKDADGQIGYGEALPRPYVTGETTTSMIAHLRQRLAPQIFSQAITPGWETFDYLQSVFSQWTRREPQDAGVIAWNAAFCAVEVALLDWMSQRLKVSLADFLPPARYEVVYSGIISADAPEDAAAIAKRLVKFGIREIKVKVGTADDVARLRAVRQAVGDEVSLRADANGAWIAEEAVERLKQLESFNLQAVEQPVAAADLAGLKLVREKSGLPVMADESLVTGEQARQLIEQRACDLFNVRLSKCGGFTGSLALAKLAQEAGIKLQVGAQVGETGILSAAGRAFAAHLPELAFAEGSFGTWLLAEDVTFDNVAFGYGGAAPLLKTRGLSVTVNEDALERLTVEKIELQR
jgi:muconate cycloisomerase